MCSIIQIFGAILNSGGANVTDWGSRGGEC